MKRPPRTHISRAVKLACCLDALGFGASEVAEIEWEHTIPLGLRAFDPVTGKYDPDEHDPRYLRPMLKGPHKIKTNGIPHIPLSGDKAKIAKAKRLVEDPPGGEEFRRRLLARETQPEVKKRKWPVRKMRGQKKLGCRAQKNRV